MSNSLVVAALTLALTITIVHITGLRSVKKSDSIRVSSASLSSIEPVNADFNKSECYLTNCNEHKNLTEISCAGICNQSQALKSRNHWKFSGRSPGYRSSSSNLKMEVGSRQSAALGFEALRFAICFWGVNRALPLTMPSIEEHILHPLSVPRVSTDIFFHSFSTSYVTSRWANEENARIPGATNELLFFSNWNLVRYETTDQDIFDRSKFANTSDVFPRSEYSPEVTLNAVRALYSLLRVSDLWELEVSVRTPNYYQAVLYLRPDLKIVSSLDLNQIKSLHDDDFLSPKYDHYGGLNDRLCACGLAAAKAFGKRLLPASAYGRNQTFRSEKFNLWALKKGQARISATWTVCGIRVRSSGVAKETDCKRWNFK